MIAFGHIIAQTYLKSAEVSHQNWNPTIRSIWLLAGRAFMNIFALVNFSLKSRARIKILTIWTTFTKPFCAIRIMFSVVWRAAFGCSILFFPRRPQSGPKWIFSALLKHHKYKWKSIKMIAFEHLITPKYLKPAEVSHQNWNHTIRPMWLLAGRAFMNMFAHVNFALKSRARINILTIWTTFTELFCAIRIMFSVVLRAAFRL